MEIEPPNRLGDRMGRNKRRHGRSILGVIHGRHHPRWLVHEPGHEVGIEREPYAVHRDDIVNRNAITNGSDFTIDRDPALGNEHVGFATGGEARPSDQLVESFDDDSGRIGISRVSMISAGGT